MRRPLVWLAVVLIAVVGLTSSGLVGVAAAQDTAPTCSEVSFSGGDGSADDPYEIENVSQLQCIEDDLDAHYELVSDVDASATSEWNDEKGFEPIGSAAEPFTGSFDGNESTISGVIINRPQKDIVIGEPDAIGLFGHVGTGGEVLNARLEAVEVVGNDDVGSLVGANDGSVTNATVSGNVTGESNVGGLVGSNTGSVTNASAFADVTGDNVQSFLVDRAAGGLVGANDGSVTNATVSGNVTGDQRVGGLIGYNDNDGLVTDATAFVNVTTIDGFGEEAGGLIGANRGNVTDATASGNVTGNEQIGGLIGDNGGNVTDATAFGNVTGRDAGGLIGYNEIGGSVTNATAFGNVTGRDVGGLVGANRGNVTDATAFGNVTGRDAGGLIGFNDIGGSVTNATAFGNVTGENNVGGLVGYNNDGEVTQSYATGNVTGNESVGGLVGENHNATIARSESTSTVTGTVAVGGLVGTHAGSEAHLEDSYATGNVAGNETGGLVGVTTDGTITQTYATGNVTGDEAIGGLVGNVSGYPAVVNQSYAAGKVTGDSDTGGRIGKTGRGPTIETTYWDTETTGQEATNQYGVSTGELTGYSALTHVGEFDFDEVWSIGSANGQVSYPTLRANPQTPAPGTRRLYDGGNGTLDDPYTIANWSHLNNTRENLNANFTVTNDLTEETDGYRAVASPSANDARGFVPISGRFPGFTGSLDGQGHAIENLTINRTDEDGVGLFKSVPTGRFGTGTVRNLDLVNVDIAGGDRTGAVAGAHSGAQTIENISVTGHIDGDRMVGGVVGSNAGHVRNVSVDGTVNGSVRVGGVIGGNLGGTLNASSAVGTVTGDSLVGGLVGDNSAAMPISEGGTILNSHAGASVEAYGLIGGLVGANGNKLQLGRGPGQTSIFSGGTISNSSASGTVAVTVSPSVTGERAGGLVGQMYLGNITRSSASATVDAPDATHVGGLVGYADGTEPEPQGGGQRPIPVRTIRESYATGDVTGNEFVGGLVGTTRNETIVHSYAVGNVTGDTAVGGLVGTHTGTNANVTEAYAAGTVSRGTDVGGLIGTTQASPTVQNTYWDNQTTERTSSAGAGAESLRTVELKGDTAKTNATGFDFQHTWDVVDNETHSSYPYLLNNTQSPPPGVGPVQSGPVDLYAGGSGTQSDPYEIGNWYHLDNVRENLNGNYTLVADLDSNTTGYDEVANASANDGEGFEPIGSTVEPFTGSFDGNESTISGVIINRPQTDEIGLFGHVGADGEVRNATLEAAEVTGGDEVGVVVGDSAGSVTNVTASGNVTGDEYVGGAVGYADSGVISDSHSSVTVNATNSVGGLVGQGSNAAIRESVATGSVNASGSWAGGLVGDIYGDSSIKNSMASGNVTGDQYVGGLVGYSKGVVTNATAAGTVSGSDNDVGGLIGYTASGELANVTAFGDVSGKANDVGGLVGDNSVTVTNATASGSVSGEDDEIGGLIGDNSGTVTNIAASGTVSGDDEVGGLIGDDDASVLRNATASGNVTGDTEAGGLIGVSSGSVIEVTASGSVTGTTDVGGLIGDSSESVVQNATASGNVTGDEEAVGGLIGDVDEGGKILNSYVTGDVSSSASWAVVGGLVGDSSGERIADSFATGNVTADGENVGGLVGIHRRGNITNVTSSGAVSGTSNVGGLIGKVAYSPDTVIRNTSATGNVTASGTKIGGFVGLSASGSGTVIDSVARGDVNVTEGYSRSTALAGGFIGKNQFTTLTNVSASGDVYIPDANRVGGLVGENNGESLTDAIARGNVSGDGDVGGLIGWDACSSELIVNATATGQVTATGDDVGGLIGFAGCSKTWENIRATGYVMGDKQVGGIVGDARSEIELINATASGDVKGTQYVGGLAGELYQPTITDSTATGDVTSTATAGSSYAGGLIGEMPAGTISASAATGNVTAAGSHAGGLIGLLQDAEPAQINESYATGDVTGNQSVGGLAGKAIRTNITNAYATGSVDGNASLGGLVGNVSGGNVTLSYAVGAVADEPAAGGLIGTTQESPTIESAYWDTETTAQSSSEAGTGLTTTQLKANQSLAGFDFQHTWNVRSGTEISYPYLQNNTQSPAPGLETRVSVDTIDARNATVQVGEQGQLVVRATASGDPAADTQIVVESDDGLSGISPDDTAVTNATGEATFSFSGPATGTYTLTVALAADETISDTATVTVRPEPTPTPTPTPTPSPDPAAFDVEIDTPADPVSVGTTVEVGATVINTGDRSSTQSIRLQVDGSTVDQTTVTLAGGEQTSVPLTWTPGVDDRGEVPITIASDDDTAATTITVEDSVSAASFEVSLDDLPVTVNAGQPLPVEYTVTNRGERAGSQPLQFRVNGTQEATEPVDLAANSSQRGTFTYRPDRDDVGPLSVTVASANDSATGSVTVESPGPADIGIANVTTTSPVTENGTLLVDATLENAGPGPGETSVAFTVADYSDETTVRLGAAETTTVTFEWPTAPGDAGTYTAAVTTANQTRERPVRVEASTTDFAVTSLTQTGSGTEDTALTLTADIENVGAAAATQDVVLRIPGANITQRTAVMLEPGASTSVTFTWTPPLGAAGSYTAEVQTAADTATTSLAVEPAVQSLRVDTAADTILAGETTTATATAVFTDTTTSTVTDAATFTVADPTIATVDPDGTVTGVEPGTTTITATYANRTATTELTVADATPTVDTAVVSTGRPDLLEVTFSPGVSLSGDDPTAGIRVTADGTPVPVTTAVATDDTLLVGLGRPVGAESNITVSYDESAGTLVGPTGVAAPSFSDVAVTNRIKDRLVRAQASASSYRVTAGTTVTLRATGSTIAPGVTPTYTWTVDGTQIAETTTPATTHTFTEAGSQTVEVRVSAQGASADDTDRVTIDVDDRPPTAALTLSDQVVTPGTTVTADANGSRDAVGIDSYAWSFGDNTTEQGPALTTPTHSYAAPGEYQVSVTVTDTNGQTDTATQSVLVNAPRADVQTEPLAFGTVAVRSTTTQTIPIENTGTETLTVTDAAIEGTDAAAYSLAEPLDTGLLTVRPGERQSVGVTFAPSTAEELSDAELVIETDDPTLPTTRIDVSGEGVDSNLTPVDSTGTFGSVAVGDTTTTTVAFENKGDTAATLRNVSATDPQVTVTDAPDTIPAGDTETVTVAFTPTQAGDSRATLAVSTDDGSTATTSLTGSGIAPALRVSDDTLTFGEIGVDESATETLAISNYGTDALTITGLDITGSAADGFTAGEPPATIAPGETATVDVTATPATAGQQDATLAIESTDPTTPRRTVGLSAEGVAATIDIGARTLDFGETAVGETVTLNLSVANRPGSPGDLQIDRTTIVGQHPEDFSIVSGSAPQTLAPGETRTLEVAFTASEVGERTAQIQLESDAANEPFATIWLTNTRSYILVQEVSNPTVNIEGENLERGNAHRVNTTTPAASDEPVTVVAMDLGLATDGDFELNKVYEYSSPESTTPDRSPGEAVIRYVTFENRSVPTGMFADRTATIDVDRAALPDGVTQEGITLQQFVPDRDTWEPVELQLVDESPTRYRFEADLQRFETLAVTAPETQLESLTLDLAATTLDVNETARVDVTAAFSDGTTDTVTPNAIVTSRDPEIAYIEPAAPSGVSVVGTGVGDTTLVANVTVGNRVVTATQPISVRAGDDTNDETSSGGGGNDDRDSGESDDDGRPSVSVRSMAQSDAAGAQDGGSDVAPTSTTGFVVSMRNVDAGEQIAVDFTEQRQPTASQPTDEDAPSTENEETPSGESAPRNVQSDGLVLTVSEEGDYELTVTARDVDVFATAAESGDGDAEPSDGEDTDRGEGESSGEVDLSTDAFDEESTRFVEATSARPVGFITVEHTFDSDDLETATHRFRVRKSYLAATGATAESVALYREEPESYRALSTRRVGEDDAYYYFEADTPGFSTFVIGTEAPIFDLGEPTLEQADVETGVIDASVPVENIGTEPGTYTVRLRGDGVVLAETEVSVPAGETVEATVRTTTPDADGLALTVAGESLGEFTVEDSDADGSERTTDAGAQPTADAEDATQPTADAEDATDEPSDTPDGSAPGGRFIALLVAAVLVVVAVWALRRRDEP